MLLECHSSQWNKAIGRFLQNIGPSSIIQWTQTLCWTQANKLQAQARRQFVSYLAFGLNLSSEFLNFLWSSLIVSEVTIATVVGPLSLITDHLSSSLLLSAVKILFKYDPLLKHISRQTMMELLAGFKSLLQMKPKFVPSHCNYPSLNNTECQCCHQSMCPCVSSDLSPSDLQ